MNIKILSVIKNFLNKYFYLSKVAIPGTAGPETYTCVFECVIRSKAKCKSARYCLTCVIFFKLRSE